jgi:uncharacterized protein (UPF0333 family)
MENGIIDDYTDLLLIGCILLAIGLCIYFGYKQYNSSTEKLRRKAIRRKSASRKLSANKKKDKTSVS